MVIRNESIPKEKEDKMLNFRLSNTGRRCICAGENENIVFDINNVYRFILALKYKMINSETLNVIEVIDETAGEYFI